ncbi:hypothetical protein Gohar_014100 [Gossypium harknessii]|uniref:RING-type E3 ubiquitin transferase n=1 Tax=Gossypium harknessii TaxID=34285 RepID=A0A7J9H272_9ROSI|nr:hypothetical protein [Gossypium harknessii]
MSMKPSIMIQICKLTVFFLFISFSAKSVSFAEIVFEESNDDESKAFQSAMTEVNVYSESESEVAYSDYCSSVVPESVTKSKAYTESFGAFDGYETGYYIGGNGILNPKINTISNSFSFETRYVSKTVADGVWKIEGSLMFYESYDPIRSPFHLKLHGFWSEFSGNLCMVGTGSAYSKQGNLLTPAAVFRLRNLRNSSNITTLITGTLESLSSSDGVNYFEPISVVMFPLLNYEYTFDFREFTHQFSGERDGLKNLAFNELPSRRFCSMIMGNLNEFKLQYTRDCSSGKQTCLPFVRLNGYLPHFLSFSSISRENELFVLVCRFLDIGESWSNAHVDDCTTRLSFRFPAILSIRETSSAMGQIWTTKTANDSGYFDRTIFRSTGNHMVGVPGLKYEYTEFNRVKNLCLRKVQLLRNKGQSYPSGHSTDLKFDMLVKSSENKSGWGSADPLAIGNQLYKPYLFLMDLPGTMLERAVPARLMNVSYEVSITLQTPIDVANGVLFSYIEEKVEIRAEGIYDSETGKLCMVGCRKLGSDNQVFENASVDCEILLNFEFSPLKPNQIGGYITGSIESTRTSSDLLKFDRLEVYSIYKTDQRKSSIWTTDHESTKVLLSNTLMCIFVGLQLYYVQNNPNVLPSISLVMLVILTLGHMVPLALDYETLRSNKQHWNMVSPHNGGLIELNEVIVTVVMVVAFLLLLRLLQLTASARSRDRNRKSLLFAEEMTLIVIAFLYAAGAKFTLLVATEKRRLDVALLYFSSVESWYHSIYNDFKSYAGLILDGFLLPQILLNMFSKSKQKALSCSFYIGTTFVRLLPHAYDLYCSLNSVYYSMLQVSVSPVRCFVSAAWDVTIFSGLLLLAAIIYLQQKFDGHCILPSRLR